MNVHVGDAIELLGADREVTATQRVAKISLHHAGSTEPESLPYIDGKLFRTLVQDLDGVRVSLELDSGTELSYGDLEQKLAIEQLELGYDDGPELTL